MTEERTRGTLSAGDDNAALRTPLTVLALLVPLGVVGELLRWHERGIERADLLADPVFARLGGLIGLHWPVLPLVALVVGALAIQVVKRLPWTPPTRAVLGRALLWTAIWAAVRVLMGVTYHQLAPDQLAGAAGLGICGALHEELLFRCLLLGGLVLAGASLGLPPVGVAIAALAISATLFSLAHTTLLNHFPGAEAFQWPVFSERCAAGLLYGIVFLRQGLAVCTLAHATYNLLLVLAPVRWW
jgi:hypothetical protein